MQASAFVLGSPLLPTALRTDFRVCVSPSTSFRLCPSASPKPRRQFRPPPQSSGRLPPDDEPDADAVDQTEERARIEAFRRALTLQTQGDWVDEDNFSGFELRKLLQEKWGRSYDISIKVTDWLNGEKLLTVNIMWRFFEQQSFPMDETTYLEHLQAVAEYLKKWKSVSDFIATIRSSKRRPRVGLAVAVPIQVEQSVIAEFIDDLRQMQE